MIKNKEKYFVKKSNLYKIVKKNSCKKLFNTVILNLRPTNPMQQDPMPTNPSDKFLRVAQSSLVRTIKTVNMK